MKSKNIVLLLLTVGMCRGLFGAQWEAVIADPAHTAEIDVSSIERLGDSTRAWYRESYPTDRADSEGEFSYNLVKSQAQYSCSQRTATLLRAVYYNEQGVEVRSVDREGLETSHAIVPDTVEERLFERACRPPKLVKAEPPPKSSKKSVPAVAKFAKALATLAKTPGAKEPKDKGEADKGTEKEKAGTQDSNQEADKPNDDKQVAKPADCKCGDETAAKVADKKTDKHLLWAYEGKNGPAAWGKLDAEWSACATGKKQSPIDIRDSVQLEMDNIKFEYKPSPLKIVDNGHTVQVTYVPGSSITINGQRYELVQFHFHRPSEERVNGRSFDMVAHLVHKNREGKLAVVAVLMQAAAENPFIRTLWNHLPLDTGIEVSVPTVSIDLNQFLPRSRAYFAYAGSLTTPPCTEGVLWIVLRSPVQVSHQQIEIFAKLYKNNARPLQSANGRLIKESL